MTVCPDVSIEVTRAKNAANWPSVCTGMTLSEPTQANLIQASEDTMIPISTILLIILILLLIGAIPSWPHSRAWGYGPSGGLGLILVIVLILALLRVF